ncbi:MAG TPA: hypothetical protein VGF38_11585 [Ktedonobacterales bacterium]
MAALRVGPFLSHPLRGGGSRRQHYQHDVRAIDSATNLVVPLRA